MGEHAAAGLAVCRGISTPCAKLLAAGFSFSCVDDAADPQPGGCHGPSFFQFSNCSVATFSEGAGPRYCPADSGSDPACGLAQLYVLRLPTQARPRGISPSPSAGTRFPQVAGMDRPARLSAQKLQASAAWTLCIVFAHFPLVCAPSATSSPNLDARWVSRRLPLMRSKIAHILADIVC